MKSGRHNEDLMNLFSKIFMLSQKKTIARGLVWRTKRSEMKERKLNSIRPCGGPRQRWLDTALKDLETADETEDVDGVGNNGET